MKTITVRSIPSSFCRAGFRFTTEPIEVQVNDAQYDQIAAERNLVIISQQTPSVDDSSEDAESDEPQDEKPTRRRAKPKTAS